MQYHEQLARRLIAGEALDTSHFVAVHLGVVISVMSPIGTDTSDGPCFSRASWKENGTRRMTMEGHVRFKAHLTEHGKCVVQPAVDLTLRRISRETDEKAKENRGHRTWLTNGTLHYVNGADTFREVLADDFHAGQGPTPKSR